MFWRPPCIYRTPFEPSVPPQRHDAGLHRGWYKHDKHREKKKHHGEEREEKGD
jgi:hypothetical protein